MFGVQGKLRFTDGSPVHPLSGGFKYILNWVEPNKEYNGQISKEIEKRWPHAPQKFKLWVLGKHGLVKAGDLNLVQVQSDVSIANVVQDAYPPTKDVVCSTLEALAPQIEEDQGSLHFQKWGDWDYLEGFLKNTFLKRGIHVCVYSNGQDEMVSQS